MYSLKLVIMARFKIHTTIAMSFNITNAKLRSLIPFQNGFKNNSNIQEASAMFMVES